MMPGKHSIASRQHLEANEYEKKMQGILSIDLVRAAAAETISHPYFKGSSTGEETSPTRQSAFNGRSEDQRDSQTTFHSSDLDRGGPNPVEPYKPRLILQAEGIDTCTQQTQRTYVSAPLYPTSATEMKGRSDVALIFSINLILKSLMLASSPLRWSILPQMYAVDRPS